MAKKKAKKKTARKAAPRKKATRKAAKRTTAKSSRKTRKPAAKAKRRSAPAKKSAPRKKPVAAAPAVAPKIFDVDPDQCGIQPPSHNVEPKIFRGSVQFNATRSCSIQFSNPSLLGLKSPTLPLTRGPNGPYPVAVEIGQTNFWIAACSSGSTSDPSEIIVP